MNNEDLGNLLLQEFDAHHFDDEIENENETSVSVTQLIFISFIWIEGMRSNSNLMWVPDEQNLYYRNYYNKKYDAWGYTCCCKECNARIFLKEDGTAFKLPSMEHNYPHESMYNEYYKRYCTKMMKDRCKTAPASTTIREIFDEAVIE